MTVDSVLRLLTPVDRAKLEIAFEQLDASFVIYAPGKYIGVHAASIPFLEPIVVEGCWSLGVVYNSQADRPGIASAIAFQDQY